MNEQIPSEPEPANPLWLFYKPAAFFAWAAHFMPNSVFLLIVYISMVARTRDRLTNSILKGELTDLLNNWAVLWGVILFAPVVLGVFSYLFFTLWYWIRLKAVGVEKDVFHKGGKILFTCSLIYALPTIGITILESTLYADPIEAYNRDDLWLFDVAMIPLVFWSIVASYRGVLGAFDPRRKKTATVLFLVLPITASIAVLGFIFWGFTSGIIATPAETDQTRRHKGASITFEYPGNWSIDTSWDGHHHESSVHLLTGGDGFVQVLAYWSDASPRDELAGTRASMASPDTEVRGTYTEGALAGHISTDWSGSLTVETTPTKCDLAIIEPRDDGWMVEIVYLSNAAIDEKLRPGVELIRKTLTVTHPRDQRAATSRTKRAESAGLSFEYPNNWTALTDLVASEEHPDLDVGSIDIDSPWQTSADLLLYHTSNSLATEISITLDNFAENGATVTDDQPITSIGPITGEGIRCTLNYENGDPWTARILLTRLPDGRVLELNEYSKADRDTLDQPGFDLIWNSLTLPAQ